MKENTGTGWISTSMAVPPHIYPLSGCGNCSLVREGKQGILFKMGWQPLPVHSGNETGETRRQPMHQAVQEQGSSRKDCVPRETHAQSCLCSCNSQNIGMGRQDPETAPSSPVTTPSWNSFPLECRERQTPPYALHISNVNSDASMFPPLLIWAGSVHHSILQW